jgi:small subunit ribosomal protein S21
MENVWIRRLVSTFALANLECFQYHSDSPSGRFGGGIFLAEVRVQEGEPLENALRRFKRKVQQEDIIKEVKRHSYYLKPGEKRRVKAALARKRNRKKARKEQD